MSSLWTPDGERPVRRDPPPSSSPPPSPGPAGPAGSGHDDAGFPGEGFPGEEMSDAELQQMEAELAQMREQLSQTPASAIIGNHCVGLFDLARVYLTLDPPHLEDASLAIDAMAAVVEGLGERLGEDAQPLRDGLAQIRMAFVQIKASQT